MSGWSFVVHVHTRHSFDSLVEPAALAAQAERLGIDVLAVTDHDTWQGGLATREAAEAAGLKLRVVLASEASTNQGDLIGMFLTREPYESSSLRFCDEVHAQGGLVLLPHPYRWHKLDEALLSRVDLIEVFNARTPRMDNARAVALAEERRLPALVGPDAHRLAELDLARVEFEGERPASEDAIKTALLHGSRRFHTKAGSIWDDWLSQAVKWSRHPDARGVYPLARGVLRRLVKPEEYRSG
jgi:predicted metal-dependent phosphoesterase TrpH